MEETAFSFHFPPSELARMNMKQLLRWHAAAARINKRLRGE